MELLIAWGHFLDEVVTYGVTAGDLRGGLGSVGVEVLDDGLLAGLVVDDGGADLRLKGHGHRHGSGLGLLLVFGVEPLALDQVLILIWSVHDDHSHGIFEVLWVLELNEETALA